LETPQDRVLIYTEHRKGRTTTLAQLSFRNQSPDRELTGTAKGSTQTTLTHSVSQSGKAEGVGRESSSELELLEQPELSHLIHWDRTTTIIRCQNFSVFLTCELSLKIKKSSVGFLVL